MVLRYYGYYGGITGYYGDTSDYGDAPVFTYFDYVITVTHPSLPICVTEP
jgi:hypothetical protein